MNPSIGRTVHFILPNGEHRPAVIVRVWDQSPTEKSSVQLQVFVDGSNDANQLHEPERCALPYPSTVWRTSVYQDATAQKPGTFHEPERV